DSLTSKDAPASNSGAGTPSIWKKTQRQRRTTSLSRVLFTASPHHQYGTSGMLDDPRRYAAHEKSAHGAQSRGARDDEVGLVRVGRLQHLVRRIADGGHLFDSISRPEQFPRIILQDALAGVAQLRIIQKRHRMRDRDRDRLFRPSAGPGSHHLQ